MPKVACGEMLGNGAVLWFQNPDTNDFHFGIDGTDNEQLVSWHAVREGVVGYPIALNHLDLWLNYKYKRTELEGLATLKDESEDGWDYKEKEVLSEYEDWKKKAILGRISSDSGVLNMVNPTGNIGKTRHILEQLLQKGLVVEDTVLYLNNCHLGPIGNLFAGENSVFEKFARMFISAEVSAHDTKLLDLLKRYRELPEEAPERKEIYKDALWTIVGQEPGDPNSYNRLIIQNIQKVPGIPKDQDELFSFIAAEVGPFITEYFLKSYNPSLSKISSFVGEHARYGAQDAMRHVRKTQPERTENLGPSSTRYEAEDERAAPSRIDTLTTDRFGNPREVAPDQQVMTNEQMDLLSQVKKLDDRQKFILDAYFIKKQKLPEIAQQLNITPQRAHQIYTSTIAYLKSLLGGKMRGENQKLQGEAVKKVYLSTAHKQNCE